MRFVGIPGLGRCMERSNINGAIKEGRRQRELRGTQFGEGISSRAVRLINCLVQALCFIFASIIFHLGVLGEARRSSGLRNREIRNGEMDITVIGITEEYPPVKKVCKVFSSQCMERYLFYNFVIEAQDRIPRSTNRHAARGAWLSQWSSPYLQVPWWGNLGKTRGTVGSSGTSG